MEWVDGGQGSVSDMSGGGDRRSFLSGLLFTRPPPSRRRPGEKANACDNLTDGVGGDYPTMRNIRTKNKK